MNMTELRSQYNDLLKEEGVDEGNTQSHLLKARLQHHFGSTLSFRRPKKWNETQYVLSSFFKYWAIDRALFFIGSCRAAKRRGRDQYRN